MSPSDQNTNTKKVTQTDQDRTREQTRKQQNKQGPPTSKAQRQRQHTLNNPFTQDKQNKHWQQKHTANQTTHTRRTHNIQPPRHKHETEKQRQEP